MNDYYIFNEQYSQNSDDLPPNAFLHKEEMAITADAQLFPTINSIENYSQQQQLLCQYYYHQPLSTRMLTETSDGYYQQQPTHLYPLAACNENALSLFNPYPWSNTIVSDISSARSSTITDVIDQNNIQSAATRDTTPSPNDRSSVSSSSDSGNVRQGDRLRFTHRQIAQMETCFERLPYPNLQQRQRLATSLGVSCHRLSTWFQNRRAKSRRIARSICTKAMETSQPIV